MCSVAVSLFGGVRRRSLQSGVFFFPSPRLQTRAYLAGRGLLSTTLGSAYRSACLGVVGSKMFCCSVKLPKSNLTPGNQRSQKEMFGASFSFREGSFQGTPCGLFSWHCFRCELRLFWAETLWKFQRFSKGD